MPGILQALFQAFPPDSQTRLHGKKAQEATRVYSQAHRSARSPRSGGDPLTASTAKLEGLFARLRAGRPGILIRLCTRAPVTLPDRIDDELVAMLSRYKPLRVVIQVNHPVEISRSSREDRTASALGLPVGARRFSCVASTIRLIRLKPCSPASSGWESILLPFPRGYGGGNLPFQGSPFERPADI